MTHCMLFCIAKEAKAFVPQVMATETGVSCFSYALAESRHGPTPEQAFRDSLQENETFERDFIGASVDECGAWTLDQANKRNTLHHNIMVVLDARSAEDQTVTLWFYPFEPEAPFLGRDQKPNTWYPFRVRYSNVGRLAVQFTDTGNPSETYSVLFRRKGELTCDNGIFDLDRAIELILNGEGIILQEDHY
ncbi:hypothetical protein GGR51DRAFT_530498 [Nemania sp. FL0031]|nr:hypothetical protein GGR51DRAFT_530498 [Nemania sp. FL0031]